VLALYWLSAPQESFLFFVAFFRKLFSRAATDAESTRL
jgi:hypothetical protein